MHKLVLTAETQQRLLDCKVFSMAQGATSRWNVGSTLGYHEETSLEPFVGIHAGHQLPISMGAFSYSNSPIPTFFSMGRYCSIGFGLTRLGGAHPISRVSSSPFTYQSLHKHIHLTSAVKVMKPDCNLRPPKFVDGHSKVTLGHDVWIGEGVRVARGITIGTGAVLAAGALVTKDVAPYQVVGGIPARLLRPRFDTSVIEMLLASEWWEYAFVDFSDLDMTEPVKFCEQLAARKQAGDLQPYRPEKVKISEWVGR